MSKEKARGHGKVSTGEEGLDNALSGGIPRGGSLLFVGPPGSGKTTLAAQFVQDGVSKRERCLFISTEQTPEELDRSLGRTGFDSENERLSVLSIHPKKGETFEGADGGVDGGVVLTDLEGNGDEVFQKPFSGKYLKREISKHGPSERVVIDSVSGLEALSSEPEIFRRELVDLIQYVTDEMDSTLVMTSEDTESPKSNTARYSADGVFRLEKREGGRRHGSVYFTGEVSKMRGADHCRRTYGVRHDEDGVKLLHCQGNKLRDEGEDLVSTKCAGMDSLLGGGVAKGESVLVEHDGLSWSEEVVGGIIDEAISSGMSVSVTPTPSMMSSYPFDDLEVDELLRNNRLFILDPIGFVDMQSPNVFFESKSLPGVNDVINDRRGDDPMLVVGNIDIELVSFGAKESRRARYSNSAALSEKDIVLNVVNSGSVSERVASFHRSAADTVLSMENDSDVCTVTLRKSPSGIQGKTEMVTCSDSPPYYNVV